MSGAVAGRARDSAASMWARSGAGEFGREEGAEGEGGLGGEEVNELVESVGASGRWG